MKDNKDRPARRFRVNGLWIVTASSVEEARQICEAFGVEPESVSPFIEMNVDCQVGAIEYVTEDPE